MPARFAVIAVVAALSAAAPAAAHASPSQVLPPQARPGGASLGEWQARAWIALALAPTATNPFGPGGCLPVDRNTELVVPPLGEGATATCRVSTGTALVALEATAECSDVEPPPSFGATDAARLACARAGVAGIPSMPLTVDGRTIDLVRAGFYSETPPFTFEVAADNILVPGTATRVHSRAAGYVAVLHPLTPGVHTITGAHDSTIRVRVVPGHG